MLNHFFGIHSWMDAKTKKSAVLNKSIEVFSIVLASAVIASFVV